MNQASAKTMHRKTDDAYGQLEVVTTAHLWEDFVGCVGKYASVLLYSCHDEPSLLIQARNDKLMQGIPHEFVVQKSLAPSSERCRLLAQVFFRMGGSGEEWEELANSSERAAHRRFDDILAVASKRKRDHVNDNGDRDTDDDGGDHNDADPKQDRADEDRIYKATYFSSPGADPRATPSPPPSNRHKKRKSGTGPIARRLDESDFPKASSPAKRKLWTLEEIRCLKNGVRRYGTGHWAQIVKDYQDVFDLQNRTGVDLKDKWRNLKSKET
jgi:hypothetical protein